MWIVDPMKMFIRAYIKFLLEEVTVIPKKNFKTEVMGYTIDLVVNERKKIPRFIARILWRNGIVEIVDEMDKKELVTKLVNLSSTASVGLRMDQLPNNFYPRLAEVMNEVNHVIKEKLINELRNIIGMRLPRLIHRLHTGRTDGMDIYEKEFFEVFYGIYEDFKNVILERMADIIAQQKRILGLGRED